MLYNALFIVFSSIMLSSCFYSNLNNDLRFFLEAASTNGKLKVIIDAVSANYDVKKTFVLSDNGFSFYLMNEEDELKEYPSFPEIVPFFKKELIESGYTETNYKDAEQKIGIVYGIHNKPIYTSYAGIIVIKNIYITSYNYKTVPLWKINISLYNSDTDIRIYLPSIIKCVAPYFDQNFKGVVTCKN